MYRQNDPGDQPLTLNQLVDFIVKVMMYTSLAYLLYELLLSLW